jgi:predicted ATPase/class 3 adenylate cyclase
MIVITPPQGAGAMTAAASSTLTFLFTDVEGSTPLWDTRPAAMRAATERHNALLRAAVEARGGNAFQIVGDAFCVAFQDAPSAVCAAIDAQRALQAEPWGDAALRVRMGLHSGIAESVPDEVFRGPALARTARVMAAAHGGQVLATAATVALLDGEVPDHGALRDLGDHTLRGFARPERLYELVVPGLASGFPPIRTQQALRTNLPQALTSFVGRADQLAWVRERARTSRLLTLVGPGGTGKTRLSLEACATLLDAFPDGIWVVELAPLATSDLVASAIATVLGARAEGDVPPLTLVETALAGKRVLLVLDNCEHVVEETARVADALLRALPHVHVLASSREALGVDGETIYRVPPLTSPPAGAVATAAQVAASEAGQLFVGRAQQVVTDFTLDDGNAPAIAHVCQRLDGIPLAIELAAARLSTLSVAELGQRLDDRFRLLTGGSRTALPRQRTLRALIDWSYDLLSEEDRRVLARLAVFVGGCTLAAAERVCASGHATDVLGAIERLVGKSLLTAERPHGSETRYRMLETIRQYASDKLAHSGDADTARARHFDCFVELGETGAAGLHGPLALEWLDRIEGEHDNLRAALDWAAAAAPAQAARLAGALWLFWDTRGHFAEGYARLTAALAAHARPDAQRLRALIGAGVLAFRLDNTKHSDELLLEAVELSRVLDDRTLEAEATVYLAINRLWLGPATVQPLAAAARALAREAGDAAHEGIAALVQGRALMDHGELAPARAHFLEGRRLLEAAGCVLRVPSALQNAGECAMEQRDFAEARRLLDDALLRQRRMGHVHDAATALRRLAQLALSERRVDEALAQSSESLRLFHGLHDRNCGALSAWVHADACSAAGRLDDALEYAELALRTFRDTGSQRSRAAALYLVARVHARRGDESAARDALLHALELQREAYDDRALPKMLEATAGLHPRATAAPVLLGSAAHLREQAGREAFDDEAADRDLWHACVRAAHDRDHFARALTQGRALSRDEAIARALALREPPR